MNSAIRLSADGNATDYGMSGIIEYVNGCARKAHLNATRGSLHSMGTLTGTLIHALLENYYLFQRPIDLQAVEWFGEALLEPIFEQARQKAYNAFQNYQMVYPPEELGKVLCVEQAFKIEDPGVVGCAPYTGCIDLVVRLTKTGAKRLEKTRSIDIEPGIWLVDHKSAGAIYRNTYESMYARPQFTAYMLGYEACRAQHPSGGDCRSKPKGLLVNILTTTKNPKCETLVVPYPAADAVRRLHTITCAPSMHSWPKLKSDRPNVSRCFDYNGVCSYWSQGLCPGF
jgi:hypothetical protein